MYEIPCNSNAGYVESKKNDFSAHVTDMEVKDRGGLKNATREHIERKRELHALRSKMDILRTTTLNFKLGTE